MSTQSTRWPASANAAARFSVVVVLATPPFWLANAMTLALPDTVGSHGRVSRYAVLFAGLYGNPSVVRSAGGASRGSLAARARRPTAAGEGGGPRRAALPGR